MPVPSLPTSSRCLCRGDARLEGAAALQPAAGSPPFQSFDTYWGQGIAAGHLHDAKLAAAALAGLNRNGEALKESPFAAIFGTSLGIKRDELIGWQAFAEDHPEAAVAAMRRAADQQDKLGQDEVDIPAREMLGDLLLLEHKPAEALAEYRVALKVEPQSSQRLAERGKCRRAGRTSDQARPFYGAAVLQTDSGANSARPELAHAVQVAGTAVAAKTE